MGAHSTHKPHNPARLIAIIVAGAVVVSGAWLYATDSTPDSPVLHDAILTGNSDRAIAIVKRGDTDLNRRLAQGEPGQRGMTPLIAACYVGDAKVAGALCDADAIVEERTEDNRTALMYAAGWGGPDCVRVLLAAGANVDAATAKGINALMFATSNGKPECIDLLVQAGADVNRRNKWRESALMLAARAGDPVKARKLLDAGADVTATDNRGETPLITACVSEKGTPELVAMLLDAGAQIDATDSNGMTSLMHAASRGGVDIVTLLLRRGADTTKTDTKGWHVAEWAGVNLDPSTRPGVFSALGLETPPLPADATPPPTPAG